MIVFGLNLSHDEACAAVVDGELRVAIENERLSRLKHNVGRSDFGPVVPFPAIRYCCAALGIRPSDVDLWVVNSVHRSARPTFVAQALGIPEERILDLPVPGHHLAHAWSAYPCSPFEDAAVIVIDTNGGYEYHRGVPDDGSAGRDSRRRQENYSIWAGRGGRLEEVAKDWIYPGEIGIGQLYMLYSAVLRLTPREAGHYGRDDALAAGGKLMGYAAWDRAGAPLPPLFPRRGGHLVVPVADFVSHFRALGLLEDRAPRPGWRRVWAHQLQRTITFRERVGSLRDRRWMALAGEAQRLLEACLLRIAGIARRRTGLANVCFAGGNALNITAITSVMERGLFRDAFVQPAANDAGNAIGAALFGYAEAGGRKRPGPALPYSTFLGREYPEAEVRAAVRQVQDSRGVTCVRVPEREQVKKLLSHLMRGEVVAVCRGRSEFGPRALGHRSLLASPTRASMRSKLNRLKGREWYRPVAPVVSEEDFGRFFEGPVSQSPFMTFSASVREGAKRLIPAVCHVDGSARVQTVAKQADPFLHALLRAHDRRTGVPVLVNTSFNFGGEPIVETPRDAIASFLRTPGVSCLLVGNWLIERVPPARRSAGRAERKRPAGKGGQSSATIRRR